MYTDASAHRIFVREEILDYRLTEKAHGNIFVHVVVSKDRSSLNPPSSNVEVLGGYSAVGRIPVLSSVDNLDTSVDVRTHALETGNFCKDGASVFDSETLCLARPKPHPIGRTTAGLNPDHVVSEFLEFVFNFRGPCPANAYDADERGNAHHQSQNRENSPNQVAPQ